MAHDKAYLICENKCLVEDVPAIKKGEIIMYERLFVPGCLTTDGKAIAFMIPFPRPLASDITWAEIANDIGAEIYTVRHVAGGYLMKGMIFDEFNGTITYDFVKNSGFFMTFTSPVVYNSSVPNNSPVFIELRNVQIEFQ